MQVTAGGTTLQVSINVTETYPTKAPAVQIIGFALDDSGTPCVCFVPYVAPPEGQPPPPGPAANTAQGVAAQAVVTRMDALLFISTYCTGP